MFSNYVLFLFKMEYILLNLQLSNNTKSYWKLRFRSGFIIRRYNSYLLFPYIMTHRNRKKGVLSSSDKTDLLHSYSSS
jgi:hypothetical protein